MQETMDAELSWHFPRKFLYKSGWQVAAGEESMEVVAEPRRELEVPEAVFVLPITIPYSPMEPNEPSVELKNMEIREIPLAFVGDGCDEMREGCSTGNASGTLEPGPKSESGPGKHTADQGPLPIALMDVDANAAAAAAAAYAVLKAKERGTLLDHNLLIKILTNPILIKTLLAFNKTLPEDLQRALEKEASNGCNHVDAAELSSRASGNVGSNPIMGGGPLPQGSNGTDLSNHRLHEGSNNQAIFGHHHGAAIPNPRLFLGLRAEEQSFGYHAQGNGALHMEGLSNQQSVLLKDLMEQDGLENNSKKAGLPQIFPMGYMDNATPTERVQASMPQVAIRYKQFFAPFRTRNDGGRPPDGGEMPNSRFQKPCLYFNTPRGCRRGNSCFYLHDSTPEKAFMVEQQGRAGGAAPFQQAKRLKFGVPDRDRNFY